MSGILSGDGTADRRERILRLVSEVEPSPVAGLSPGVGAVSGTVRVHDGTVEGPLTDGECVLYEHEKGRNEEGRYRPVEGRVEAVPFLVGDESGRALVDPTGYGYEDGPLPISPGRTEEFEGDEAGENVRAIAPDDDPVLPWIHAQASIRPGDEVYVLGTVSRAERTGGSDLPADVEYVLAPGDAAGEFVLTDLSRPALYRQLDRESPLSGQFWRFAVLGLILVTIVLTVLTIFLFTFVV